MSGMVPQLTWTASRWRLGKFVRRSSLEAPSSTPAARVRVFQVLRSSDHSPRPADNHRQANQAAGGPTTIGFQPCPIINITTSARPHFHQNPGLRHRNPSIYASNPHLGIRRYRTRPLWEFLEPFSARRKQTVFLPAVVPLAVANRNANHRPTGAEADAQPPRWASSARK